MEWDWEAELQAAEANLLSVELTPEDVCHLARHLPPDSSVLARVEVSMRDCGFWREPATA